MGDVGDLQRLMVAERIGQGVEVRDRPRRRLHQGRPDPPRARDLAFEFGFPFGLAIAFAAALAVRTSILAATSRAVVKTTPIVPGSREAAGRTRGRSDWRRRSGRRRGSRARPGFFESDLQGELIADVDRLAPGLALLAERRRHDRDLLAPTTISTLSERPRAARAWWSWPAEWWSCSTVVPPAQRVLGDQGRRERRQPEQDQHHDQQAAGRHQGERFCGVTGLSTIWPPRSWTPPWSPCSASSPSATCAHG